MSGQTFVNPFSGKIINHPLPSSSSFIDCIKDIFTISSNGQTTVVLSQVPKPNSVLLARGGQTLSEGAGEDYQISGQTVTFEGDVAQTLHIGEKILAQYIKL